MEPISPPLWTPSDTTAIPNKEDFVNARQAIGLLERVINERLELIERTQREVEALRNDLYSRKAWIAPIRRIPTDILSLVFAFHNKVQWDAPFVDRLVCRLWRETVLNTPMAWSHLRLDGLSQNQLLLWYNRCGEVDLHIATRHPFKPSLLERHRQIRTLDLINVHGDLEFILRGDFERLVDLRITVDEWRSCTRRTEQSGLLDVRRFPQLTSLYIDSPCESICKEIPTSTVATFPPLQHLHLSNPAGPDWIKMINCCSGSLRTLRIDLNSDSCGQSDQKKLEIKLPMLRRFTYTINWVFGYQPDSGQPRQPPVVFRTPVLEIYEEERTYPYAYRGHPVHPSTLLHDDVSNVRAIHIGGISIPACVLRSEKLEILSVSAAHILDTGARIFREQDACPNLRVLRISEDTGPSIPKATYEKVEMLINLRNQRSSKGPEDYLVFDLEKRYETNHPESKPHVQGDIDMAAKTAHSRAFTGY